ncbi:MAG: ATP-binding protein [Sphaerochaeta sp.]
MHIFGYQRNGFEGLLVPVSLAKSNAGLSILGLSVTKAALLRKGLQAFFSGPLPSFTVKLPKNTEIETILAPVLLALQCGASQLSPESDCALLVHGTLDLSGHLKSPPVVERELDQLAREAGISLIITGENIRLSLTYWIASKDIPSAYHQAWHHVLRHQERRPPKQTKENLELLEKDPFNGILGLVEAKKALCYAVAGELPLLFYGPPGSGKTILLKRAQALLPPLQGERAQEVSAIHERVCRQAPVVEIEPRTSSLKLLQGTPPFLSLAHGGILMVDELSSQRPKVITLLAHLMDTHHTGLYPVQCTLLAATNGCRCANLGSPHGVCRCSQQQIDQYWNKIGWPFLDRFAIAIALEPEALIGGKMLHFHYTPDAMDHVRSVKKKREAEGTAHLFPLYSKVMAHDQKSLRRAQLCCTLAQVIADWEGKEQVSKEVMERAYSLYLLPKDRHYR